MGIHCWFSIHESVLNDKDSVASSGLRSTTMWTRPHAGARPMHQSLRASSLHGLHRLHRLRVHAHGLHGLHRLHRLRVHALHGLQRLLHHQLLLLLHHLPRSLHSLSDQLWTRTSNVWNRRARAIHQLRRAPATTRTTTRTSTATTGAPTFPVISPARRTTAPAWGGACRRSTRRWAARRLHLNAGRRARARTAISRWPSTGTPTAAAGARMIVRAWTLI